MTQKEPRICDYEGSQYRTEFWENQNRDYEDRVERVAMQKLVPPKGQRIIEVGAGFGRLTDLYEGYEQIVLTDYARTQMEEAQAYIGADERFTYVVANVYQMPFVDGLFDTLTMIRVMHHLTDVRDALTELRRIIKPQGTAIIEHASKLNLKAIGRWLLGRQEWSPFSPEPIEFVELNFNFHPAWMRDQFEAVGFYVQNRRTVSHYRIGWLKRNIPTDLLVTLDGWAQGTGNWWQLTPSIFVQAQARKPAAAIATDGSFFCCPVCRHADLKRLYAPPEFPHGDLLVCQSCQRRWTFRDNIYDFKTPLGEA